MFGGAYRLADDCVQAWSTGNLGPGEMGRLRRPHQPSVRIMLFVCGKMSPNCARTRTAASSAQLGLLFFLDASLKSARFQRIPKTPPEPSLSELLLMGTSKTTQKARRTAGEASSKPPQKVSAFPISSHARPKEKCRFDDAGSATSESKLSLAYLGTGP